jgi:SnoaL-like polyketide cyclase
MPTSCSSRCGSTLEYSDRSAITHSHARGTGDEAVNANPRRARSPSGGRALLPSVPRQEGQAPYDLLFGDDDCTCFVTRFTGTFAGPLELPDGTVIQPTGKSFDVFFSTTARWRMGKIVEEYLFYDSATFMKQIGLD